MHLVRHLPCKTPGITLLTDEKKGGALGMRNALSSALYGILQHLLSSVSLLDATKLLLDIQ